MASVYRANAASFSSLRHISCPPTVQAPRLQGRRSPLPLVAPRSSAADAATEQLTRVAARLSTVRCRELLAASCVELLKTALVGSMGPEGPASSGGSNSDSNNATPEATLEALHASLQASLQDAAHQIASEHQEAWGHSQWEAFQAAHAVVQRLLLDLHSHAAAAGSAVGALQVARCLEHGLLVPQDASAAFLQYQSAASLGSAEAALRCGIHHFEGTAPGGRDGAQAFDYFSQALDLLESSRGGGGEGGSGGGIAAGSAGGSTASAGGSVGHLPRLAPPSASTAVEGDVPEPLSPDEVRFSALTWMGRCYLEGAGVERNVRQAAEHFRQAGNTAELAEIAALKQQFAGIADADLS